MNKNLMAWMLKATTTPFADDCLLFPGSKDPQGYGQIYFQGTRRYTHRVAYTLAYGTIPKGLWVLHRCKQQRACCNPAHLYLGTPQDNSNDMMLRDKTHWYTSIRADQHARGEQLPSAVLTADKVREIRSRYAAGKGRGVTQAALAREYHVADSGISRIVNYIDWKHIE